MVKRVVIALIVIFCGAFLHVKAAPAGSAPVDRVLSSYVAAEEAEDYARVYKLFCVAEKKKLKEKYKVRNAADYVKFRESSEAHWFGFRENNRRQSKNEAIVIFSVTVEETGVQDKVTKTLKLLFQNGRWCIDSIKY